MRKGIRILCCCLAAVCADNLHARQPDSLAIPRRSDREFARSVYEYAYGGNPAMLSWWDYAAYSSIGAGLAYEKGSLHHPQKYDRLFKGTFDTESILHLPKGGWSVRGRFVYENGSTDSVRSNLSYWPRQNGSPSFYFCRQAASRWNLQRYGLEATAAKRLGERWSAGALIDYKGDLAFRKSDVRNSQTTLSIKTVLSASYNIGGHIFSAGFDYRRNKEKPSFVIAYSTGPSYIIYLMNGMGTYITDVQNDITWRENTPGAILQWMQRSEKNRFSLTYRFASGNDQWKQQGILAATTQEDWTDYDFTVHEITFHERSSLKNSYLTLCGNMDFTAGNGRSWNRSSNVFIQNYDYSGMSAGFSAGWHPFDRLLKQLSLGANYESEKRHDKSYDYRFDHSMLAVTARAQAGFYAGKVAITMSLDAAYHHSLDVDHRPRAATEEDNEYTKWVGIPLAEWFGTNYASAGASFYADIPFKRTLICAGIGFDRAFYTAGESASLKNQGFTKMNLFLNVYF